MKQGFNLLNVDSNTNAIEGSDKVAAEKILVQSKLRVNVRSGLKFR